MVEVLPDSGADVCVGGLTLLKQLGEHQDNLHSSSVTPHAVNNTTMKPMRKLPITIRGLSTLAKVMRIDAHSKV